MKQTRDVQLLERAKEVLAQNWTGVFTQPAPKLYPHLWNWDSGFIAIGYAHFAQEKAEQELRSLLRAQWQNGMVPHIVLQCLQWIIPWFLPITLYPHPKWSGDVLKDHS